MGEKSSIFPPPEFDYQTTDPKRPAGEFVGWPTPKKACCIFFVKTESLELANANEMWQILTDFNTHPIPFLGAVITVYWLGGKIVRSSLLTPMPSTTSEKHHLSFNDVLFASFEDMQDLVNICMGVMNPRGYSWTYPERI